jgi:HSP20 family protein
MFDLIPFRKKNEDVVRHLVNSINDVFNEDFFAPLRSNVHQFRTDIRDRGDAYLIESDLPGFSKENIEIDYSNHYLTIKATRKHEEEDRQNDQVLRSERSYGEFVRRFYVENIQYDNIKAKFQDGVLMLEVPKKEKAEPVTKKIEIL